MPLIYVGLLNLRDEQFYLQEKLETMFFIVCDVP